MPTPDEDPVLEAAAAPGEGPGLVHDQLRLQEPALPRAGEDRGDREAERHVAGVEEDRGDDRGGRAAAVLEDRRGRELGRAGERRRRHHHRAEPAHARVDREQPERGAEEERCERERQPGADAVAEARGLHRLDATERARVGAAEAAPTSVSDQSVRVIRFSGGGASGECAGR